MATVLISFLGKAYRPAVYDFGNGVLQESSYFGLALTEQVQPNQLVLLGTTGSMWDALFADLGQGDEYEEDRLKLIEDVYNNRVAISQLERLTPLLERRVGKPCRLRIIPYGTDEPQQTEILAILANEVNGQDQVYLDLTHGFRHLPMLGLLSALYLRTVKKATIMGLYYGALDMTEDGKTPVVSLDGLLTIADWIGAVDRYDQSGDYGVFEPLLQRERALPGVVKTLKAAAFHERTSNSSQAKEKLSTFNQWFKGKIDTLTHAARLFRQPLLERMAWIDGKNRAEREWLLAGQYLERKDYLRAVIFGYESQVTKSVDSKRENAGDFAVRREHAEELRKNSKDFKKLDYLRNAMAHGLKSEAHEVADTLSDEKKLTRELYRIFGALGVEKD